jgi:hypothetical protein
MKEWIDDFISGVFFTDNKIIILYQPMQPQPTFRSNYFPASLSSDIQQFRFDYIMYTSDTMPNINIIGDQRGVKHTSSIETWLAVVDWMPYIKPLCVFHNCLLLNTHSRLNCFRGYKIKQLERYNILI